MSVRNQTVFYTATRGCKATRPKRTAPVRFSRHWPGVSASPRFPSSWPCPNLTSNLFSLSPPAPATGNVHTQASTLSSCPSLWLQPRRFPLGKMLPALNFYCYLWLFSFITHLHGTLCRKFSGPCVTHLCFFIPWSSTKCIVRVRRDFFFFGMNE